MTIATRRQHKRTLLQGEGSERQIDDREMQQLVDRDQPVLTKTEAGAAGVQLWDCIDGAWTNPLPADKITNYLYHKNVIKCSACSYTAGSRESLKAHISARTEHSELHRGDVQLTPFIGPNNTTGMTCSACGDAFASRKGQAQRHLSWWREQGPLHVGAGPVFTARFALQQPVAEGIQRRISAPADDADRTLEAPHASEEQRSKRRRRRRRSRGHKEMSA